MGRPRTPSMVRALARARQIQAERRLSLRDLEEALKKEGHEVSIKTLSIEGLAPDRLPPAPASPSVVVSPPPAAPPPPLPLLAYASGIDADGTPIDIARGMLRAITTTMAGLDRESGPYAKLSAEARQCTKLIAALESAEAGKETPEEADRRRRREDGETVLAVSRYVDQALALSLRPTEMAPHGSCPTCEQPLTLDARTMLLGGP